MCVRVREREWERERESGGREGEGDKARVKSHLQNIYLCEKQYERCMVEISYRVFRIFSII